MKGSIMTALATAVQAPHCPTWCDDRATNHAEDVSGHLWGTWVHRADVLDADGLKVWLVSVEARPEPIPGDDYGVFVDLGEDKALTSAQTRTLATAITAAADMIEREH